MKKIITSVFVVLSALTACTVQNQGQSYDEVYYSPKDGTTFVQQRSPLLHKSTKETVIKTDATVPSVSYIGKNGSNAQGNKSLVDSGAYVTDNNFNYDDYYDYSYASRIRRFQYSPFNDYYHDYYTNRYWYDYNPGYWGSSIYNNWGMGMGMSNYMDPFSMSWGMYSPFNNFYSPFNSFYDPFYSPFSYGYGYSPFGYGYYGLGYGGYGYGGYGGIYSYSGGYNNSFDQNSKVYYGPRRDGTGTNGPIPSERTAFSQRYNALTGGGGGATGVSAPTNGRELINNNASGSTVNSGLRDKVASANQAVTGGNQREPGNGNNNLFGSSNTNTQRGASTREQLNRNDVNRYISDPVKNQQINGKKTDTRSLQQQQGSYFKDRAAGSQSSNNGNQRYQKPQQNAAPQQYYNPVNSRPRSSNEYTSPGYRNPAIYNSQQYTPQQRSASDPQRYAPSRSYQAPSNSSGTRQVSNYNSYRQESSTPSSYNSPSRSSNTAPTQTYSAPTQTYSAPAGNARESGSSSSSPSSSSGSSSTGPRR